jgi:hypothetical protein
VVVDDVSGQALAVIVVVDEHVEPANGLAS